MSGDESQGLDGLAQSHVVGQDPPAVMAFLHRCHPAHALFLMLHERNCQGSGDPLAWIECRHGSVRSRCVGISGADDTPGLWTGESLF